MGNHGSRPPVRDPEEAIVQVVGVIGSDHISEVRICADSSMLITFVETLGGIAADVVTAGPGSAFTGKACGACIDPATTMTGLSIFLEGCSLQAPAINRNSNKGNRVIMLFTQRKDEINPSWSWLAKGAPATPERP